jgi:hypothetical protein
MRMRCRVGGGNFGLIILLCDRGDSAVRKRKGCHGHSCGAVFSNTGRNLSSGSGTYSPEGFNPCASISARYILSRIPLHLPHPLFLWQSLYLSQRTFETEAWASPGVRIAVNALS